MIFNVLKTILFMIIADNYFSYFYKMVIEFYKYQGTGNDFIMIDDRENIFDRNDHQLISSLCERKMGVGADGLILLRNHSKLDFEMIYFNSDGYESSMCGNGGRCIIDFARALDIIENEATFMAIDGEHKGRIIEDDIYLRMRDVNNIETFDDGLILNTGSPHYVKIVSNLNSLNVKEEGNKIRNSPPFISEGININFVLHTTKTKVRTYERGVEDETLSCGTGVVASAIAMHYANLIKDNTIEITTLGGSLSVDFERVNESYQNIWLIGEASMVYSGEFEC